MVKGTDEVRPLPKPRPMVWHVDEKITQAITAATNQMYDNVSGSDAANIVPRDYFVIDVLCVFVRILATIHAYVLVCFQVF